MASFRRRALYIAAILVLLSLAACSREGDVVVDPGKGAPSLPALSTMIMDLSSFGAGESGVRHTDVGPASHWAAAAATALHAYLSFYEPFEEPIDAFAAAAHSIPHSQPNGSWLWTFVFVDDDTDYSIFLYGREIEDHVDWRMEVSSNNPSFLLDRFTWLDGQSQTDDSFGYWQFYSPDATALTSDPLYVSATTPGNPSLRVDWQNIASGGHVVSALVNEAGSVDENDIVTLSEVGGAGTFVFLDASARERHSLTRYSDGSGSITAPSYNSGRPSCWDSNRENTVCR